MSDIDVRIVALPPMRVASFWGFGPEPEGLAWEKLNAWARPRGMLEDADKHPLFGFNNPDPSPGSPNYGYEVWIQVESQVQPDGAGEPRIEAFDGGLYAVTRCEVPKAGFDVIGRTWKRLVAWREDSPYRCGAHQWLERSVPTARQDLEFVLDLYLPIAE